MRAGLLCRQPGSEAGRQDRANTAELMRLGQRGRAAPFADDSVEKQKYGLYGYKGKDF